ncbi:MAG: Alkaline phosphatase precursor, partial [Acidobacteria bacterium]|nr:Alkaline phosphatase precursor [Acidobacteriota bacterium]
HDHLYERFAPQDPDGRPDPARGIRQFIVGTGGAALYPSGAPRPNSEMRISAFGVLRLTLASDGYDWEFVGVPGPRDSGAGTCH